MRDVRNAHKAVPSLTTLAGPRAVHGLIEYYIS